MSIRVVYVFAKIAPSLRHTSLASLKKCLQVVLNFHLIAMGVMPIQVQISAMDFGDIVGSVEAFQKAFKLHVGTSPDARLTPELIDLRHRLMAEENEEYLEAARNGDMVEIADALGDQLYILCGTIVCHGMQDVIADVFKSIQDSNMSKLGADGQPIYREDGKVLKGPGFFAPDLKKVLESHGVDVPVPSPVVPA
jgi:predicted HAD superfamily Cof-like phosphohydrolase